MRDHILDPVGIVDDGEVKSPISVYPGLPDVLGGVIFLCPKGRVVQVFEQKAELFGKRRSHGSGRVLQRIDRTIGKYNFHRSAGRAGPRASTLPYLCLNERNSFFRCVEWSVPGTFARLGQPGIDDSPLIGCVLVIGVRQLRKDRDDSARGPHFKLLAVLKTRPAQGCRWNDNRRIVFYG